MRTRVTHAGLVLSVAALCTLGDLLVKALARARFSSSPPISLWGGLIRIDYSENLGGLLGLGGALPGPARFLVFTVAMAVLATAVLAGALLLRRLSPGQRAGLALIAGGGLGNLLDRIFHAGAVTDYLSLGVGTVRTGVFNLADLALLVGILMVLTLRSGRPDRE